MRSLARNDALGSLDLTIINCAGERRPPPRDARSVWKVASMQCRAVVGGGGEGGRGREGEQGAGKYAQLTEDWLGSRRCDIFFR